MLRNQIIYIPYVTEGSNSNDYIIKTIHMLSKYYSVCPDWIHLTDVIDMLRTKAVILNWVEGYLDEKIKNKLLAYKRMGIEVIWVFHNKMSHDGSKTSLNNAVWLSHIASKIVLLSENSKDYLPKDIDVKKPVFYIPIVKCEYNDDKYLQRNLREKYSLDENSFVFLISGYIRPYKQFEKAIQAFTRIDNKDVKLIIVGEVNEVSYKELLVSTANDDDRIVFDFRFVSDYELGNIINLCDVGLIPYNTETVVNSGAIINAFSCSRTVLSTKFAMSDYFNRLGLLELIQNDFHISLVNAINKGKDYYKEMGLKAKRFIDIYHREELVEKKWIEMLELH